MIECGWWTRLLASASLELTAVPEPGVPIHWFTLLKRLTSGVLDTSPVWDAHAHIGRDRDGRELDVAALIRDLDDYHVNGAVIFPFNDPDQGVDFRVPNDRIWAASTGARSVDPVHATQPEWTVGGSGVSPLP